MRIILWALNVFSVKNVSVHLKTNLPMGSVGDKSVIHADSVNSSYTHNVPQMSSNVKSIEMKKMFLQKIPKGSTDEILAINTLYIHVPEAHSISFNFIGCMVYKACSREDITAIPVNNHNRKFILEDISQRFFKTFESSVYLRFQSDCTETMISCSLSYVILPKAFQPSLISNRAKASERFVNCPVKHTYVFIDLFTCNMKDECDRGQDEQGCNYRSEKCGPGMYE